MTCQFWLSVSLLVLAGCSAGSEGSARSFFDAEFKKCVVGQPNEIGNFAPNPPLGYVLQSVAPDQPDFMAHTASQELPADWKTWPAFRFNVSLKSKVGLDQTKETVSIFTLTWNPTEQKWYVKKRFL